MIKKYSTFIITEGVNLPNEDIVDILKNLEDQDNKNSKLINKLVNSTDKNGKNVLMNIVEGNNEELIDYILKFNPNIHQVTSDGKNVLFFCKKLKIFEKFYNLGVDVKLKTKDNVNILTYLSSRKIFNKELYQKLINDGVDINNLSKNNTNVLCYSILNKGIIELLIKNNVNLNINKENQRIFLRLLFDQYKYIEKLRKNAINIFEILFENGLNIFDKKYFVNNIIWFDDYLIFIEKLKNCIPEEIIMSIFFETDLHYLDNKKEIALFLLNLNTYPNFYNKLKTYYRHKFYKEFEDYIKEHPYMEDISKYNL